MRIANLAHTPKTFLVSEFTSWACSPLQMCRNVSPAPRQQFMLTGPKVRKSVLDAVRV